MNNSKNFFCILGGLSLLWCSKSAVGADLDLKTGGIGMKTNNYHVPDPKSEATAAARAAPQNEPLFFKFPTRPTRKTTLEPRTTMTLEPLSTITQVSWNTTTQEPPSTPTFDPSTTTPSVNSSTATVNDTETAERVYRKSGVPESTGVRPTTTTSRAVPIVWRLFNYL